MDFVHERSTKVSGKFGGVGLAHNVTDLSGVPDPPDHFSSDPPAPCPPRAHFNKTGVLPPTIGKLASLTYLNMFQTKVSGKFGGVVIGPLT